MASYLRKGNERAFYDHGWLKTHHTFSFGEYQDPNHIQFGPLRVINEDYIQAGQGFPRHGHRDMEIITYVLEGCIGHEDSTGGKGQLYPGDIQVMSAGKGILHSEFNGSPNQTTHILQIWILPNQKGLPPRYDQKNFSARFESGQWVRVAGDASVADHAMLINQRAHVYVGELQNSGQEILLPKNCFGSWYLHIAIGDVSVQGSERWHLVSGDGLGLLNPPEVIKIGLNSPVAKIMLFDLPSTMT